jgi:large subunit ribosomal protein L30e
MSYKRGQMGLKKRKRTSSKATFDENKEINVAVKTGKVLIGSNKVLKEVASGDLKLLVLANNTPKEKVEQLTLYNNCLEKAVPIFVSKNSSKDLGSVCGKPYWIAMIGIQEPGDSSILNVIES